MEHAASLGDELVFFGRAYSSSQYQIASNEQHEAARLGADFVEMPEAKLDRYSLIRSLVGMHRHLIAVATAWRALRSESVDVVVSFGGYIGLHLAIAAYLRRVPVVVHEQTIGAGLANRIASVIARSVAVSYQQSVSYFPRQKSRVTGNLIRHAFFEQVTTKPEWWRGTSKKPILYVTGGNQGSVAINTMILELLPRLTKRFFVIHQTGSSTRSPSYDACVSARQALPVALQRSYVVAPFFDERTVVWVMQHARVVITRAGANTVAELMVTKLPAVLLPLPGTSGDEQRKHAHLLASAGCGVLLDQAEADPGSLHAAVLDLHEHHAASVRSYAVFASLHSPESVRKLYMMLQEAVAGS